MLAADPDKRWMEKFVLVYSLIWIGTVGVVMGTRAFTRWGDRGHLLLGLGLAAPLWIVPLIHDRGRPFAERYSTRFNLWIGLYSLLQTYFGSALFFDVLHMEYHFPVKWILNRTPIFLYFMTIAYFSTYYVVMSVLWRRLDGKPAILRWGALIVMGYAVAFAETAGMANEWLRDYFSYRDKSFVLIWGSAAYGSIFVLSMPFVFRLDEDPARPRPPLGRLVGEVLAVNMAALCVYEVWGALLG